MEHPKMVNPMLPFGSASQGMGPVWFESTHFLTFLGFALQTGGFEETFYFTLRLLKMEKAFLYTKLNFS